jgi:septal ring factor EnvC (AmiA/AmiB activator)
LGRDAVQILLRLGCAGLVFAGDSVSVAGNASPRLLESLQERAASQEEKRAKRERAKKERRKKKEKKKGERRTSH